MKPFARVIAAASLRDTLWLEESAGVFGGESSNIIGRLSRGDFVHVRLKVYF